MAKPNVDDTARIKNGKWWPFLESLQKKINEQSANKKNVNDDRLVKIAQALEPDLKTLAEDPHKMDEEQKNNLRTALTNAIIENGRIENKVELTFSTKDRSKIQKALKEFVSKEIKKKFQNDVGVRGESLQYDIIPNDYQVEQCKNLLNKAVKEVHSNDLLTGIIERDIPVLFAAYNQNSPKDKQLRIESLIYTLNNLTNDEKTDLGKDNIPKILVSCSNIKDHNGRGIPAEGGQTATGDPLYSEVELGAGSGEIRGVVDEPVIYSPVRPAESRNSIPDSVQAEAKAIGQNALGKNGGKSETKEDPTTRTRSATPPLPPK
jgi:hypothetical protein